MACHAVETWTLTSLLGVFLDLTLAFFFLFAATIAFFASKFLSHFGFSLPCTCDGTFNHLSCAQKTLLIEFPITNLSFVHRSLRSRFPFGSLFPAGVSPSCRCRCGGRCHGDDGLAEEGLVERISDLEKSCSELGEGVLGGAWDSDEEGLGEEASDGEEKDSCHGVGGLIGCDEREGLEMMRSLERELEEERAARETLYLELEKERSAAASAADEAMAMILRLQKEKAEIDMEARQYQRMVEEKSVYDEEEMEILKEIIVRREREKHVLEKEVEMYKKMSNFGERVEQEFDSNEKVLEGELGAFVDFSDDPMLMLRQIYKSVGRKEEPNDWVESSPMMNSGVDCSNQGYPIENFVGVRKHSELFNNTDDCDQEFQEKTILTTHSTSSSSNILNTRSLNDSVPYNLNVPSETENYKTAKDEGERATLIETIVSVDDLCRMGSDDDSDQRCNESFQIETESNILDVHVIDDGHVLQLEEDSNQNIIASEEDSSCANFDEMELNIRRSCSEITNRINLIDSLSERSSCFNQRSLLPSVESERSKIEDEVDVLRKRLEIIRQGRENLSLHADQKEKETFQLKLLDEITFQLKEIKKVTKPSNSLRRSSLPPLSSKFKAQSNLEI